jgi:hypothetical protein
LEVSCIRVLALDDIHPVLAALAKTCEDEHQEIFGKVNDFFPGIMNLHFEIKTGKL